MQYALINNGAVETFPYSIGQLRKDHPNTSFPKKPTDATLASYGVHPVKDTSAPSVSDTEVAYHTGKIIEVNGEWEREWSVRAKTQAELDQDLKQEKQRIKKRRDEALNSGTTVNGVTVATDDLSQQRITSAALSATADETTTVNWKMPDDTFVTLDAAQIIGIAQAVRAHVQACFDREAEILDALAAGQAYDIDSGWPAQPE